MAKEYLDKTGLAYFWGKIKAYVADAISGVSDDHKWNDVELNKSTGTSSSRVYIPQLSTTSGVTATLVSAYYQPTAHYIAKFDASKHMNSEDMSASDVTSFIDSLSGTPIAPADYVVETSSNSYWRWVKWNSGRVELWGWFSQANVSAYATNSFVIGSASVCPYPFTISEPRTIVSGQKIGTGGCVVDYDYGRTDYWSGIAHGTISSWAQGSTATITWTCYVNARWK